MSSTKELASHVQLDELKEEQKRARAERGKEVARILQPSSVLRNLKIYGQNLLGGGRARGGPASGGHGRERTR